MKETSILFSTDMVRATLDGRKTQTRRIIKPQPPTEFKENVFMPLSTETSFFNEKNENFPTNKFWLTCPYGQPGDRLWVRETWRERWGMSYANYGCGSAYPVDDVHEIEYKAGGSSYRVGAMHICPDECTVKISEEWSKWRPSIHMPKEAARIWLEIDEIRVERVRDISEEDASQEGVINPIDLSGIYPEQYTVPTYSYREGFKWIWMSLNKKQGHTWEDNSWVWVIKFHVIFAK